MKDIELWHGDCLDLMANIPDGSVDMALCDLPYAHLVKGKTKKCTANHWDDPIDLVSLWSLLSRIAGPSCTYAFTATQPFASHLISSSPALFKYDLVWEKAKAVGWLSSNRRPMRSHENILIFQSGRPPYNPQKEEGKPFAPRKKGASNNYGADTLNFTPANPTGLRHPRSVIKFAHDGGGALHPTAKPVALVEWLIKTYTNPGDLIVDPTAGSMSAALAARNTGRRCIAIEKDAEYYRSGAKRVKDAMTQPQQEALAV